MLKSRVHDRRFRGRVPSLTAPAYALEIETLELCEGQYSIERIRNTFDFSPKKQKNRDSVWRTTFKNVLALRTKTSRNAIGKSKGKATSTGRPSATADEEPDHDALVLD